MTLWTDLTAAVRGSGIRGSGSPDTPTGGPTHRDALHPPARPTTAARSDAQPVATWPGTIVLVLVSAVGMFAFTWPFFADPDSGLAHSGDAPWLFAMLMTLLGLSVLAEQATGRLDAKTIAVLGVIAALGGSLRLLSAGTAGLEPVFFLVVVAGRVLGRRLAFLSGCLILLLGAFLTGGIGPWAPFQMIATGWVALGAALLPAVRGRVEIVMLAGYGLFIGLGYGLVMNLWFWPFMGSGAPHGASFLPGADPLTNLGRYGVFYVATSLGWDLPRGILTCVLISVAGPAALATLRRAVRTASFEARGEFR